MNTNESHPSLEQLNDYVHGELVDHEDAAVHAHLATCATCAETHDTEVRLGEMLREHARAEERELPLGFAQRIVDAAVASQRPAGLWEVFGRALRPAVALPLAAGIALAAYFGLTFSNHGAMRTATIDAAAYIDNHAALATDMPFAESTIGTTTFSSDDEEAAR